MVVVGVELGVRMNAVERNVEGIHAKNQFGRRRPGQKIQQRSGGDSAYADAGLITTSAKTTEAMLFAAGGVFPQRTVT